MLTSSPGAAILRSRERSFRRPTSRSRAKSRARRTDPYRARPPTATATVAGNSKSSRRLLIVAPSHTHSSTIVTRFAPRSIVFPTDARAAILKARAARQAWRRLRRRRARAAPWKFESVAETIKGDCRLSPRELIIDGYRILDCNQWR